MSEMAGASRIEAIDSRVFELIRDREDAVLIGTMMREVHRMAPGLSLAEAGELDLRLKTEGFLSPTDANKSLAGLAILARVEGDKTTAKSLRSHFTQRFNLGGAQAAYGEKESLDNAERTQPSIDLFC